MKDRVISATLKATSIYIVLMTITIITADLYAPCKDLLKGITGHHWVTKGVLGAAVFAALVPILKFSSKGDDVAQSLSWAIGTAIIGTIAIGLFYILHYFA